MKYSMLSAAMLLCLTITPAAAGPGDPFGGSETGCIPSDKLGLTCGKVFTAGLGKLTAGVIKCHLVQAGHAFQTGHSSTGFDNAEENCSVGNPSNSAKAKFDAYLPKAGFYCGPAVVATMEARRDTILADASNPASLDALNGAFFCDTTSGLTIAEPGGGDADEAGSIPADANTNKCSVVVAKAYSKLVYTVYKCHAKAAKAGFANKPFDTDLCEETPTKGALARYDATIQKYITAGICPPCLADSMSATNALALGAAALANVDAQNEEIYPCPGP